MRQKLTLITLGVRNFQKTLSFYEGLGWQKSNKNMIAVTLKTLMAIYSKLLIILFGSLMRMVILNCK